MAESQKEKIMRLLKCSAEEAESVIASDKIIDKGGRTEFDLSPEAEKEAKKFANSRERKRPTVYDFKKRERKANPTKGGIISELAKFLSNSSEFCPENVEIVNKERQIAFSVSGNQYELTLVQKRPTKN